MSNNTVEITDSNFEKLVISSKKIKILAEGEGKLLVQTKDEIKHPANRRAEISPSD